MNTSHQPTQQTPRRVLVLWADNKSANLGVQVLARGALELSRRVWGGDTQITLQDFEGKETGVRFGLKSLLLEQVGLRRNIRDLIASHDIVLDTGAGDSFTNIYGYKRMAMMFLVQRMTMKSGVPLVLLPQTLGPFRGRFSRVMARRQLASIDFVMSRDSSSTRLSTILGRVPDVTSSDLVFALPQERDEKNFDILFNVSGLLWVPNNHVNYEEYRQSVVQIVTELQRTGRTVTLFGHVVNGVTDDDDAQAIEEAQSLLETRIGVYIPDSLKSARTAIASSKLVIGARMHACLNALSQGVPAIPWAYSVKFEPLLGDLGWPHFVDLQRSGDYVGETMELLTAFDASDIDSAAQSVAESGRKAIQLTADGLSGVLR